MKKKAVRNISVRGWTHQTKPAPSSVAAAAMAQQPAPPASKPASPLSPLAGRGVGGSAIQRQVDGAAKPPASTLTPALSPQAGRGSKKPKPLIEPAAVRHTRELQRRVRRSLNDYDLDREAHIFSPEACSKIEQWCHPLYVRENGIDKPDLEKWAIWLSWNLGTRAGLRGFEIGEIFRNQIEFDREIDGERIGVIGVWGKCQRRTREELDAGMTRKAPRYDELILSDALAEILKVWFEIADALFPDIPHIVIRPGSRKPLELPSTAPGEPYTTQLCRDRSLLPKVNGYEDWSVIDRSRGKRDDAGPVGRKSTTGTSHNLRELMHPMFVQTGLYREEKLFLSQRDRLGRPGNMRHHFATKTVEALSDAKQISPQQLRETDVRLVANQMRHAGVDVIEQYLHLSGPAAATKDKKDNPFRKV